MAKLVTNASSATWWPKLEPIQVVPPGGARSTNCWPNLQKMQVAPSERSNSKPMQVAPTGGQAKLEVIQVTSYTISCPWPNLEPIQVTPLSNLFLSENIFKL